MWIVACIRTWAPGVARDNHEMPKYPPPGLGRENEEGRCAARTAWAAAARSIVRTTVDRKGRAGVTTEPSREPNGVRAPALQNVDGEALVLPTLADVKRIAPKIGPSNPSFSEGP